MVADIGESRLRVVWSLLRCIWQQWDQLTRETYKAHTYIHIHTFTHVHTHAHTQTHTHTHTPDLLKHSTAEPIAVSSWKTGADLESRGLTVCVSSTHKEKTQIARQILHEKHLLKKLITKKHDTKAHTWTKRTHMYTHGQRHTHGQRGHTCTHMDKGTHMD